MYFVNGIGWTATPYLYRDDNSDDERDRYGYEEYFDREAMEYCGTYEDDDDDDEDYEYALSLIKELFE
jgi:hypothetical protein